MAEEILWTGGASQIKNTGASAGTALAYLIIVAAAIHFKPSGL